MGVLRCGRGRARGAAAPGLSQLDALVSRARAAGLPVELHVEGQRATLSPGLDLVAYRVVQEALTNAIKHAGPARAQVNVTFGARELELEVSDSGQGLAAESQGDGSGHGLRRDERTRRACTAASYARGRGRAAGLRSARGSRSDGVTPMPLRSRSAPRRPDPVAVRGSRSGGPGWIRCSRPCCWWRWRSRC